MCSLCYMNPCHPNCPNAPESKPVYFCDLCGDGIYDGEPYYHINDNIVCEACIDTNRYIAETPESYEPDPMDLWKARKERELCDGY